MPPPDRCATCRFFEGNRCFGEPRAENATVGGIVPTVNEGVEGSVIWLRPRVRSQDRACPRYQSVTP